MRLPSFADPANLVVPEEPERETIPDDVSIQDLAEQVVRGKVKLTTAQQRMLIELLPFYMPKLTAVAHFEGSFAEALERAIEKRANRPPPSLLLEAQPAPTVPAAVMKKPFVRRRV